MPSIDGYWFHPSTTASAALRRTSSGPGSSGKPWPRLTASCSRASRDITSKTETGRSAKTGFMEQSLSRDQAGAALEGQIAPKPLERDDEAIAQADQEIDVRDAPDDPGWKTGKME